MDRQSFTIRGRLAGLNEYTAACRRNRYSGAKLKREQQEIALAAIEAADMVKVRRKVDVSFTWVEPNMRRDHDNVAFQEVHPRRFGRGGGARERRPAACWELRRLLPSEQGRPARHRRIGGGLMNEGMTTCGKPSRGRYVQGCRCYMCRVANAEYAREQPKQGRRSAMVGRSATYKARRKRDADKPQRAEDAPDGRACARSEVRERKA